VWDAIRDTCLEAQEYPLTYGRFWKLDLGCGKGWVSDDFWVEKEGI
jgi:hypothetical protein